MLSSGVQDISRLLRVTQLHAYKRCFNRDPDNHFVEANGKSGFAKLLEC